MPAVTPCASCGGKGVSAEYLAAPHTPGACPRCGGSGVEPKQASVRYVGWLRCYDLRGRLRWYDATRPLPSARDALRAARDVGVQTPSWEGDAVALVEGFRPEAG